MSRHNLGNKQTIVLHNCIGSNERYDLLITPHRQIIGYIRAKRQTLRKKMINKQKQIIRKRFSKQKNALSESDASAIQKLLNFKDSMNKNHQNDDQIYFFDSETTSPASIKGKRRIKKVIHKQTNTFVQLKSTNKTH